MSEVVAENCGVEAHYEYAPFGAIMAQRGDCAVANPWRFASEYAEEDTATVYYNYRHYNVFGGRWLSRDLIEEIGGVNLYMAFSNGDKIDEKGLKDTPEMANCKKVLDKIWTSEAKQAFKKSAAKGCQPPDVNCACCNDEKEKGRTERTNRSANGNSSAITLCAGANSDIAGYRSTLKHELQHAKDACEFKKNKLTCEEAAASEVRAYSVSSCTNLSGDAKSACVKNGAKESLRKFGPCAGENISGIVDSAYDANK